MSGRARRSALLCWLAAAALAAAPAAAAPEGAAPPLSASYEGVAVELELATTPPRPAGRVVEGDDVTFRFELSYAATSTPLAGVYPAAWVDPLRPGGDSSRESCVETVEEFLAGNLFRRAELDLNVYYVLALNDDASITVVDPLFGYGSTKLLAMVRLDAPGEDWALSADQGTLFVSQPAAGTVAVVDTASWRVRARVDVGPRPRRLALQDDGAYLWVVSAAGDESTLVAVDARALAVVGRVPLGSGPHDLVLADDRVFVTSGGAGTLTVVDPRRPDAAGVIETGPAPVSVAWSSSARSVWVGHADGSIAIVGGEPPAVRDRVATAPGLGRIAFAPGGRRAFAVNPETAAVQILDAASPRVVQSGAFDGVPIDVRFSDELAYVLHRDSETVLMIPLDEIGTEGAPIPVVDFPGGQRPFGEGRVPSLAPAIVQAPGAPAVLVANPADRMIYYYKEGMAAPMGGFRNYGREPRAVLVVDRSLRERRPGVYETVAGLRGAGRYRVAFFLDAPRVVHCFEVDVAADKERERERLARLPARVEPLFSGDAAAGQPVELRYRLRDPSTGEPLRGLDDVTVMIYTTDHWSRRLPADELGDGIYGVTFVPDREASFLVAVACPSRRLAFHHYPPLALDAVKSRAPTD